MSKANVDNRNMKRLQDEEQVRQRPTVIFGTNDEKGAFKTIDEIVANSVDEAREGYGKSIRVTVEAGDIVTIEDDGRGLPMDWNEDEQMYNWELALCTLYASGKYDSSQYSASTGLNGLGLTATQYASVFMDVWSTYGGKTRYMHFEKGKPIGELKVTEAIKEGSGTKVRFQPDPEVFPALKRGSIDPNLFLTLLNSQAMLQAGLEFKLKHYAFEDKEIRLFYEKGALDYIEAVVEDKKMLPQSAQFTDSLSGADNEGDEPYNVNMKITFNFCRDTSLVQVYHNGSYLFEGGESVKGFENGITKAFTEYARSINKLSRTDRFKYKDIESMLICVAATEAPGHRTAFKNQTKGAVLNPFIGKAFEFFVYTKMKYWLENGKGLSDRVIAEAVINKKAREEGAEASKKVVKNLSKAVSFNSRPKNFRDCSSKIISERELYVVEGRSALGSVKLACNPKFQAVMALRGKPINCLKENVIRTINNDIVSDLYRIFGCGLEVQSKYLEDLPKFDIKKLKWGKIIICTDADVDGNHIRCLVLTMMYILSPSLLKSGRVFIAETPLYEITYKKKTYFAYDDNEKDKILDTLQAEGATMKQIRVQRSKGLGENDPEMMSISTMKPETRRLIPVQFDEADSELSTYFNALLGDDIETRRLLIDEYFKLIPDDLD